METEATEQVFGFDGKSLKREDEPAVKSEVETDTDSLTDGAEHWPMTACTAEPAVKTEVKIEIDVAEDESLYSSWGTMAEQHTHGDGDGWSQGQDGSNSNSCSNLYPVMLHQNAGAYSNPVFPGSSAPSMCANPLPGTSQDMSGFHPSEIEEGEEEHDNADPHILEESDSGVLADAPADIQMPVLIKLPCPKIKCLICNRQRAKSSQLVEHYVKHHGLHNFTYRCETCMKTFAKLHALECHMPKCKPKEVEVRTATDFPYGCSICGELFKTQLGLSQHERHLHPAAAKRRRMESRQRDIMRKRARRRAAAGIVLDPEELATEYRPAVRSTKAWPASCTRIMLEVMVRKGIERKNVNVDVLAALSAAGWQYNLKQISSRKSNKVFLALYAQARAAGRSQPDRTVPIKADTLDPSLGGWVAGGSEPEGTVLIKAETLDPSPGGWAAERSEPEGTVRIKADTLDPSPGGWVAGGSEPDRTIPIKVETLDPSPGGWVAGRSEPEETVLIKAKTVDPRSGGAAAGEDLGGSSTCPGNKKKRKRERFE